MILEQSPDIVLCMGDFADMGSLSSYDKGKKSAELKRYKLDLSATHDALERINYPLNEYNKQRKNIRKGQRKFPRKMMLYGNHDQNRIMRAVNSSPELEGVLDVNDLKYRDYGWETYAFKQPVEIEGIWVSHYFVSGVKAEPIGGYNAASLLLQKNMSSCISAHSHLFDYAVRSRPDGTPVIGLVAGWYGETPTYDEATQNLWWSGLIMLNNVKNGYYDIEQFSIDRVQKLYG